MAAAQTAGIDADADADADEVTYHGCVLFSGFLTASVGVGAANQPMAS